ncbi:CAMK family protein kinase [Tritrichomonas foetus]|uniref:non-specific serine/threonine protein kinase n=1 Tax=Tritrichomonas foetus TaxID=1144522 RepID=A0A1J4KY14_9EUKA|nr:CAMK family protein kinase [Tritrichomonas foetus]|eukprot:OHT14588.1 CAMK family protein kinase [Tritrichomonas foetus]
MNPLEQYSMKVTLGEGGFAEVFLAIHRETGTAVAIKIIPANDPNDPDHKKMVEREIDILSNTEHPCIYKLFDFIRTEDKYYLIFEYLDNGKLLDFVNINGRLFEKTARRFFTQLISALSYLHKKSIAHRDIKAENVLLDRNFNLRLIDFGLSNYFNPDFPIMRTICGCQAYAPPEMLREQPYTPSADVWSSGILLYAICAGYLPFSDPSIPRLIDKVINEDPVYPNFFSTELCDLLHKMLDKNPIQRISISEIMNHPWVTAGGEPPDFSDLTNCNELNPIVLDQLRIYNLNESKIVLKNEKIHFVDRPNSETVAYRILKRLNDTELLDQKYKAPYEHLPNNFSVLTHMSNQSKYVSPTRRVLYKSRSKATALQRKHAAKSVYAKGPLKLGYV